MRRPKGESDLPKVPVVVCVLILSPFLCNLTSPRLNSDQGLGDPRQGQCEEAHSQAAFPVPGRLHCGQILLLENEESPLHDLQYFIIRFWFTSPVEDTVTNKPHIPKTIKSL